MVFALRPLKGTWVSCKLLIFSDVGRLLSRSHTPVNNNTLIGLYTIFSLMYWTYALASFHWLRIPELIKFKLAVIVYRALHGAAPQYWNIRSTYLPTRRRGRLRSSTSNLLDVRLSRCVTVGDRSFATAGPRLWNSLPADVRSASSLTTFRQKLKTHLFRQSYPDIVL